MPNSPAIIIDNGSGFIRSGCTGDKTPRSVLPAVVAESNKEVSSKSYIGAAAKEHASDLQWPIQRGNIVIWEQIEKIWSHVIYDELKMTPHEHPLFLTEPTLNSQESREKAAQIGFETFRSPALFLGIRSVLSLYSYGQMFGIVVKSGFGITEAVPVYEGFCQPQAVRKLDVAGQDLDEHLTNLLKEQGMDFSLQGQTKAILDVKENLCYVTDDFDAEMKKGSGEIEKSFRLPDGKEFKIDRERFSCPELLFQPSLNGRNGDGIHKMAHEAREASQHKELYNTIYLSGGSTLFRGLKERLEKEVSKLAGRTISVKAHDARNNAAFIGASILTALPTFDPLWLTKQEYEEQGPGVLHTKLK